MRLATVLDVRNKLHHFHLEWADAINIEISIRQLRVRLPALVEVDDRMWIVEMKQHRVNFWAHPDAGGETIISATARRL